MKLNFTVRTLLILTTLVAVVLNYYKLFGWDTTNVCLGILTIFVAAGLVQQIAEAPFPVAAGAVATCCLFWFRLKWYCSTRRSARFFDRATRKPHDWLCKPIAIGLGSKCMLMLIWRRIAD